MRAEDDGIMGNRKLLLFDYLVLINCYCPFRFFKYLRNVSIEGDLNKPNIEFTADGDLKSAELKIMNLRPGANNKNLVWEEVCFNKYIICVEYFHNNC